MSHKSIAKSAGVIASATLISRILGFIRIILMARLFGTAKVAQAFVVAFRIPNLIRDLVGEGAANSTVVPVLSGYLHKNKQEFWELAHVLCNFFLVILTGIVILGITFAPAIVSLIAPGFLSDTGQFSLTVKLTRIIFPYLLLIGLSALGMGILNTLKSFAVSSFGPCIFNIAFIASILIASKRGADPVILAWGILAGGFFQLLIQVPPLLKRGFSLKLGRFKHPGTNSIGRLMLPRIFGSGVYLLNVFIDTVLASLSWIVGRGGVAAIYYANRLIQFPLAIFGFALSNAALPTMSIHFAAGDLDKLKSTLSFSLRALFLLMIPSAVGLCILSGPIIKVLFQRGEFTAYSTLITSSALLFYSLGLPFYGATKILSSCFYAIKDTRTPVKAAAVALVVNTIFNLILIWPLKIGGLALASSIASLVNVFILYFLLTRKIGKINHKQILDFSLRIIIASALMGIFILWLRNFLVDISELLALLVMIIAAVLVFFILCLLLRVKETKSLMSWILKRN